MDSETNNDMDAITAYLTLKYEAKPNTETSTSGDRVDDDYFEKLVKNKRQNSSGSETMVLDSLEHLDGIRNVNSSYKPEVENNEHKITEAGNEKKCLAEPSNALTPVDNFLHKNDFLYQNWVNEEEEVIERETETDKYLEELKKGHGLLDTNLTDNSKIVEKCVSPWGKIESIPNLSEIDIDQLFRNDVNAKFDTFFKENKNAEKETALNKNSIKKNSKPSSFKANSVIPKPKSKIVAKPMKGGTDFKANVKEREIESWMSQTAKKSERAGDVTNSKKKKANYFDILNNLEEIECTVDFSKSDGKQETIDQENDGRISKNSSYDDIVSILEALENEDKKSRKLKF